MSEYAEIQRQPSPEEKQYELEAAEEMVDVPLGEEEEVLFQAYRPSGWPSQPTPVARLQDNTLLLGGLGAGALGLLALLLLKKSSRKKQK